MHIRNVKILEEMETGASCARYIIELFAFKRSLFTVASRKSIL